MLHATRKDATRKRGLLDVWNRELGVWGLADRYNLPLGFSMVK
jgi:hypothetical protein